MGPRSSGVSLGCGLRKEASQGPGRIWAGGEGESRHLRVTLGSTGAGSRWPCVPSGLRVTHWAEASLTQKRGWGLMSAKSSRADIECPLLCDLRQVS